MPIVTYTAVRVNPPSKKKGAETFNGYVPVCKKLSVCEEEDEEDDDDDDAEYEFVVTTEYEESEFLVSDDIIINPRFDSYKGVDGIEHISVLGNELTVRKERKRDKLKRSFSKLALLLKGIASPRKRDSEVDYIF